jgi:hypothetical protein
MERECINLGLGPFDDSGPDTVKRYRDVFINSHEDWVSGLTQSVKRVNHRRNPRFLFSLRTSMQFKKQTIKTVICCVLHRIVRLPTVKPVK